MTEKLIHRGVGYKVYLKDGSYFVDTYGPFATGYNTLEAACEALYYGGYIESKSITSLK